MKTSSQLQSTLVKQSRKKLKKDGFPPLVIEVDFHFVQMIQAASYQSPLGRFLANKDFSQKTYFKILINIFHFLSMYFHLRKILFHAGPSSPLLFKSFLRDRISS